MTLSGKQLNHLRGLAHHKTVTVTVGGRGLTDPLISEATQALEHHELVKVRLPAGDKQQRSDLLDQLCQRTGSQRVQLIGRVGVLFKPAAKPVIKLP